MSKELTDAKRRAIKKYDAKSTRQIHLKLNLKTDKDILDKLDSVESIQGYIKELIRLDMEEPSLSCHIVYKRIKACHDCNDCGNYGCGYDPDPGETTRINCPLWKEKK